ncbi:MAG TPA: helix-turn-helix transcriptional regulator [Acidobacteriaceae bacterium]|nr:helix-turn-helix transcriptional regulator [Acidobacteriaceae bacterium]
MAPIAVPTPQPQATAGTEREVLRCAHCNLVQFRTINDVCRKCKKSLLPDLPKLQPIAVASEPVNAEAEGIQVAAAVRDLRHVRNLSQRQLAGRMNVPRTYISKIENGKAMPTLSSLDRLARALQVDISALLRDAPTRHKDETAVLMNDPFLAEIAKYTSHLTSTQKSIFLNHVRELAQGRARKLA